MISTDNHVHALSGSSDTLTTSIALSGQVPRRRTSLTLHTALLSGASRNITHLLFAALLLLSATCRIYSSYCCTTRSCNTINLIILLHTSALNRLVAGASTSLATHVHRGVRIASSRPQRHRVPRLFGPIGCYRPSHLGDQVMLLLMTCTVSFLLLVGGGI